MDFYLRLLLLTLAVGAGVALFFLISLTVGPSVEPELHKVCGDRMQCVWL